MAERNITTQGSVKFKQYIEDLLRNKHFIKTAKKLMDAQKTSDPDNSAYKEVEKLIKEYKKLDIKSRKWLKKNYSKLDRTMDVMAEDYGLDMELLRPVLISLSSLKDGELLRIPMTKSIKSYRTKCNCLKLKCLNIVKQITNTKILLLQ